MHTGLRPRKDMNTQTVKRDYVRWGVTAAASVMLLTLLGLYALACSFIYLAPSLPTVETMRNVELQVPLRVYTRSGELIAQIGEQRRIPVTYDEIPPLVRQAFLAAEDDAFFKHSGVDYVSLLRAVLINLVSAEKAQGASTITQQAARNMFLTLDKTWRRKLAELFVTFRMEREFTKEEILGLYLNVIFFGQRAYGVAAAAETYFGKPLDQLTVSEAATLAGIPQAPSRYNPITHPELAAGRRAYVLRRMRELGFIDEQTVQAAKNEPILPRVHAPLYDVEAPYVAEMARLEIRARFGPEAERAGYKVYTTIDGRLQTAANRALRLGLLEYDRRHGWRGPLGHAEVPEDAQPDALNAVLDEYSSIAGLQPAVIVSVSEKSARAYVKSRGFATIDWDGLSWARKVERTDVLGPPPKTASDVIKRGDVVYVLSDGKVAQLVQVPEAQAALVALDPKDGAVVSLVGGFDYFTNKYNRVTQARRLPGSAFKPFLYSAALEDGFTPASVVLDAPVVLEGEGIEAAWRPENSGGLFHGPTRLREALVRSRNLVSIRLLRSMGTKYSIDYITRFGFSKNALPPNLTLALGTLQTTPLELASAYAVFANGGFRVQPYFIERIENSVGKVVYEAEPRIACAPCEQQTSLSDVALFGNIEEQLHAADAVRGGPGFLPKERLAERVISAQNAYLLTDMMSDVIRRGTGRRALVLGRNDIAGKTGTTNDAKDAWFNGFTPNLVAGVWVGFDQERSLGEAEEGGRTALPIWVHFMREALKGVPERRWTMPDGLIQLRISPVTGLLASGENPDAILETFMIDHLPAGMSDDRDTLRPVDEVVATESLF
jgi:penicillin-binding protein 1A